MNWKKKQQTTHGTDAHTKRDTRHTRGFPFTVRARSLTHSSCLGSSCVTLFGTARGIKPTNSIFFFLNSFSLCLTFSAVPMPCMCLYVPWRVLVPVAFRTPCLNLSLIRKSSVLSQAVIQRSNNTTTGPVFIFLLARPLWQTQPSRRVGFTPATITCIHDKPAVFDPFPVKSHVLRYRTIIW